MKTNEPSSQNKFVVLLLAFIVIGLTVAWNMPVKKAIKHFANQHFKVTKEVRDTSHLKITSDKAVIIPKNNSSKIIKVAGKKMTFDSSGDTTIKSKNKFKIVLEDSIGNKKEYSSIEELPADMQKEFLKQNENLHKLQDVSFSFEFPDSVKQIYHSKFYNSEDLKRQAEEMRTIMNSPKVKKQMENLHKQLNSPEYKKKMAEIRYGNGSPEWKKQEKLIKSSELISKNVDSLNWEKQMEKLNRQATSTELKKQIEKMRIEFRSPKFQKQLEDIKIQGEEIRKQFDSPEWKKQQKKIQKEIEKSQKEWRKSMDIYLKPALPAKTIVPQK